MALIALYKNAKCIFHYVMTSSDNSSLFLFDYNDIYEGDDTIDLFWAEGENMARLCAQTNKGSLMERVHVSSGQVWYVLV